MVNIAILVSGTGTNAENLIRHFHNSPEVRICAVLSNRADAPALQRLAPTGIPMHYFPRTQWRTDPTAILQCLSDYGVDLIVLAGFLEIITDPILDAYPNRIVNLHPSLLPRHGGKGMYGHHVHEAVLRAGDTESGITIHLVNQEVDGGRILAQHRCPVLPTDDPDTLAGRIHELEYQYFPQAVLTLAQSIAAALH